jgi:hypothetical protein
MAIYSNYDNYDNYNNNNNNNNTSAEAETNFLGADNNQTGKAPTHEDQADNLKMNLDRAIKGPCVRQ